MANPVLKTSAKPMSGGVDANTGDGQINQLAVTGTWTAGDLISIVPQETLSGFQLLLGAGDVTGLVPTFLLTYQKKLNFLSDTNWYFSAIDLPTTFNDFNTAGNGFIELANNFATSEDLLALVPFQGRMAVNGRTNLQLWSIAADPADYQLVQTLPNTPTVAKFSVVGIGEMDALFLTDTGVRSLRVISTTLNAESTDTGSPIDLLIQALLLTCSASEKAAACGVREPSTGLYWLFIKNTIYTFAYYPSVKILAWSQWDPTYETGTLTRLSNATSDNYFFKIGQTATPTGGDQVIGLVTGPSSVNGCLPGAYLHVFNSAGTTLVESLAITGGLSFRGLITYSGEGNVAFTSNQTAFSPQKFVVHEGRVFARTSSNIFTYGGATNTTYDNVIAVLETSWLPFDAPGVHKTTTGIDVDMLGSWNAYGSTYYLNDLYNQIFLAVSQPTFIVGNVGWRSTGTHCRLRLQTSGLSTQATVSEIMAYYAENQSKGVNK